VWRVEDISASGLAAVELLGGPTVWHSVGGRRQRDYDQAIAVGPAPNGRRDRLYIGGSAFHRPNPENNDEEQITASLWCYDVMSPSLVAAADISDSGSHASPVGLIGDDVHPDVHAITLTNANSQLWVACDGGVFVSTQAGRVNSFASRSNGLAAAEVNFVANHPQSSQYVAIGCQDTGRPTRIGDVIWEDVVGGDGGGVVFHASSPHLLVSQIFRSEWKCNDFDFVPPVSRPNRDDPNAPPTDGTREDAASIGYSGAASIKRPDGTARVALGTNRVWVTDDLGQGQANTWVVLPYHGESAMDARQLGQDLMGEGVPSGTPCGSRPTSYWHCSPTDSCAGPTPATRNGPLTCCWPPAQSGLPDRRPAGRRSKQEHSCWRIYARFPRAVTST
jgi:hypothetical protein